VLPWACRIRPRPCARRSQRALSGCRSWLATRVQDPRAGDDHNVALGSGRPTPERAPAGHSVAQPAPRSARSQRPGYPRLIAATDRPAVHARVSMATGCLRMVRRLSGATLRKSLR
jgi:hypothetical protein